MRVGILKWKKNRWFIQGFGDFLIYSWMIFVIMLSTRHMDDRFSFLRAGCLLTPD